MSWSSEFEAPPPRPPTTGAPSLDPSAFDDFWSEDDRPDQQTPDVGEPDDLSIEEPITVDELVAGLSDDGEEADSGSPTPPSPPDPKPPSMPQPSDQADAVSDLADLEIQIEPDEADPADDATALEVELGAPQAESFERENELEELDAEPSGDDDAPTSFFGPSSEPPLAEAVDISPDGETVTQQQEPLYEADPSFPTDVGIAVAPDESPALARTAIRSTQPSGQRTGRTLPLLVAVFVGGFIGLIGAVAASQLIGGPAEPGDNNNRSAENASETSGDDESPNLAVPSSASDTSTQEGTDRSTPLGPAISAASPFELNGLRFLPGTVELDDGSQEVLGELAQSDGLRSGTIAATIRTTSESGDAANLELSIRQAEALRSELIDLGFSADQLNITAIGRKLVTHREWVPNFVLVSTGLERSALRTVAEGLPPFSLGIDPRTSQLRTESVAPLASLAEAMQNDPNQGSITLAAYAFRGEDAAGNDQLAALTAAVIENELSDRYGIASDRVDIIVVADAPFAVPQPAGGMVSFYWTP